MNIIVGSKIYELISIFIAIDMNFFRYTNFFISINFSYSILLYKTKLIDHNNQLTYLVNK